MEMILKKIKGKKTYIGIVAGVAYMLMIEYMPMVESSEMIWGAIVTWTGVSMRAAIGHKKTK